MPDLLSGKFKGKRRLTHVVELYQSAFQQMLEGFALHEIILDEQGQPVDYRFLAINPAFEQMTGLKASEAVGKTARQVLPDLEPFWVQTYGQVALTGESVRFEQYVPVLQKFFQVSAFSPQHGQFVALFVDITERGKAYTALMESEARNRALFENAPSAIFRTLPDGTTLEANPACASMFGYLSPEKFLREVRNANKLFADPARRSELSNLLHSGKAELDTENRLLRRDGSQFTGLVHLRAVMDSAGHLLYMEGFVEDISQRKQAEELATRFGRILDASPDGIFFINSTSLELVGVNRGAQQSLGYSEEELHHKTLADIDVALDPAAFAAQTAPLRRGEIESITFESLYQRKDGSQFPAEVHLHISHLEDPPVFVAVVQDISQRKQAEQALRLSEEKFAMAFRQSPDAIAISEYESGIFIEMNDGFARLSGYSKEEGLGHSAAELGIWHDLGDRRRMFEILQREGRVADLRCNLRDKAGNVRTSLISAEPFEIGGKRFLLTITRDISQQIQVEEALRMAQEKLASTLRQDPDLNST